LHIVTQAISRASPANIIPKGEVYQLFGRELCPASSRSQGIATKAFFWGTGEQICRKRCVDELRQRRSTPGGVSAAILVLEVLFELPPKMELLSAAINGEFILVVSSRLAAFGEANAFVFIRFQTTTEFQHKFGMGVRISEIKAGNNFSVLTVMNEIKLPEEEAGIELGSRFAKNLGFYDDVPWSAEGDGRGNVNVSVVSVLVNISQWTEFCFFRVVLQQVNPIFERQQVATFDDDDDDSSDDSSSSSDGSDNGNLVEMDEDVPTGSGDPGNITDSAGPKDVSEAAEGPAEGSADVVEDSN
jgi:hypothetical protein